MSLNASVFPDLGLPSLAPDFSQFSPGAPGMAPYVEAVVALTETPVWEEAQYRVVVAHSFGGMLALSWLLDRPDLHDAVHGLVLVGTTAGPMFDAVRLRVAWWRAHELRIGIAPLLPLWNSEPLTRGLQRLLNRGTLDAGSPVNFRALPYRDDLRVGLAGWQATAWEARRAFRWAMQGFDVRARLGEIPVPAIVLHGDRDCYFSEASARELADGLPRGELRVIEDAGHVLPLTHGEAVDAAVNDLLHGAGYSAAASST